MGIPPATTIPTTDHAAGGEQQQQQQPKDNPKPTVESSEILNKDPNEPVTKKLKSAAPMVTLTETEATRAVEKLVELIQFETVSSVAPTTGAYRACATWLVDQLRAIPCFSSADVWFLPEAPHHSPVVVAVWKGRHPHLPVLLLNSHYDVVPADAKDWTVAPPFAGLQQEDRIYGRGTQDMKSVCIQYIEAIQKLHTTYPEWQPERSIYLTFVPDEGTCIV